MLQNYGKRQIKNILFLLWKWLHVKRRETEGARERRGRGAEISPGVSKHWQQGGERGGEGRRKGGAEMIQSGFEHTRAGLFNSLPDAVWKSAHRRETKPSQSLSVSHILTYIHARKKVPILTGAFQSLCLIHYYTNGKRQKLSWLYLILLLPTTYAINRMTT